MSKTVDIKCEKCGAEYPEEWGVCQCVVLTKTEKKPVKAIKEKLKVVNPKK